LHNTMTKHLNFWSRFSRTTRNITIGLFLHLHLMVGFSVLYCMAKVDFGYLLLI